jgi:translation initiation factor 3 subunit E
MTTTANIEQWDLTSKVSPYLDRHMMFPLLEYMDTLINAGTVSYSSKDVAAARLALLRPTHMVDYAIDIYRAVHGEGSEIPKEMEDGKTSVYKRLEELEKGCKSFHELCANAEEKVSTNHVVMFTFRASVEKYSHILEIFSFSLDQIVV